jgi:hypothetical protein
MSSSLMEIWREEFYLVFNLLQTRVASNVPSNIFLHQKERSRNKSDFLQVLLVMTEREELIMNIAVPCRVMMIIIK